MANRTLVWLRNDLRLADNAALYHALEDGEALAVYLWDECNHPGEKKLGEASKQWLHHSLSLLKQSLGKSLLILNCPAGVSKETHLQAAKE